MDSENQCQRIKVLLFLILVTGASLVYRTYQGQLFTHPPSEKKDSTETVPPSIETLFAQANQQYKEKKYNESIALYRVIIKQEPNHLQAHISAGLAAARLGMIDDAQHHAQNAIKIDRKYLPGYILLGQCYQEKKEFDNAKNSYLTALEQDENLFEAYLFLSQLLIDEGTNASCAQAVMYAQKAIELKPNDAVAASTVEAAKSLEKTLLKNIEQSTETVS